MAALMMASCSSDDDTSIVGGITAGLSVDGYENGYAYVDLNLPSGLKWATMNVGATEPTGFGKYYSWGETVAGGEEDITNVRNYNYNSKNSYVKSYYDWTTYKWSASSNGSGFSKYGINKKTLDPIDDAATQNWGGT